jgi:predicted amidohydrolase
VALGRGDILNELLLSLSPGLAVFPEWAVTRFLSRDDSLRVSLLARFECDPLGAFYGQTANLVGQLTIILGSVLAFDESLHVAAPKKSDASV